MRLALGIEYCGKNFNGWQQQLQGGQSVQAELEQAITQVANHPVKTICAGRTDAGVHASGQVVHCDVEKSRSERDWVFGCNRWLTREIRVLWAKIVPDSFHARRSATQRHYKYVIYNNQVRPSLLGDFVGWHYYPLNVSLMQEAAQLLIGEHDFSSFRGAGCQSKTQVRHIKAINLQRHGDMIILDIYGNAFLYHMVRNMVGVLLEIGGGKRPVQWAYTVLQARDRTAAAVTAPAQGLYLVGVQYPSMFELPSNNGDLWFLGRINNELV
jgi:tRNA pseudouridine38-40 synthase